jgi:hypothetical protein
MHTHHVLCRCVQIRITDGKVDVWLVDTTPLELDGTSVTVAVAGFSLKRTVRAIVP